MNKASSRSHCLFTIHVQGKITLPDGEGVMQFNGKLHMVDLAGSESAKSAGNDMSCPDVPVRERERAKINHSLFNLGRVTEALKERSLNPNSNTHVPYRDSKLTRVLHKALDGPCKTIIIATISPSITAAEESISTLNYAHSAKGIVNTPVSSSLIAFGDNIPGFDVSKPSAITIESWLETEMKLQNMVTQVDEVQAALARKHIKKMELQARAEKAESEVNELSTSNKKMRGDLTNANATVAQLEIYVSQHQGQIKRLRKSLVAVELECESGKAQAETSLTNTQTHLETARGELAKKEQQYQQASSELRVHLETSTVNENRIESEAVAHRAEIARLNILLSSRQNIEDEPASAIEELTVKFIAEQANHKQCMEELKRVTGECTALTSDLANCKESNVMLESRNQQKTEDGCAVDDAFASSNAPIGQLTSSLVSTLTELIRNELTKNILASTQEEVSKHSAKVSELESNIDALSKERDTAIEKMNAIILSANGLDEALSSLNKEKDEICSALEQSKKDIARLEAEKEEVTASLNNLQEMIVDLESQKVQIATLTQERDEQRQLLDAANTNVVRLSNMSTALIADSLQSNLSDVKQIKEEQRTRLHETNKKLIAAIEEKRKNHLNINQVTFNMAN